MGMIGGNTLGYEAHNAKTAASREPTSLEQLGRTISEQTERLRQIRLVLEQHADELNGVAPAMAGGVGAEIPRSGIVGQVSELSDLITAIESVLRRFG